MNELLKEGFFKYSIEMVRYFPLFIFPDRNYLSKFFLRVGSQQLLFKFLNCLYILY